MSVETSSDHTEPSNAPADQDAIPPLAAKPGSKLCTLCHKSRDVLVRCQIDDSGKWHFVCPGKCWTGVSGGEVDARGRRDEFPFYRYGGMWKNRQADGPLNAKKPKKGRGGRKEKGKEDGQVEDPGDTVATKGDLNDSGIEG